MTDPQFTNARAIAEVPAMVNLLREIVAGYERLDEARAILSRIDGVRHDPDTGADRSALGHTYAPPMG